MRLPDNPCDFSLRAITKIADNYNDWELQHWARSRIHYLLMLQWRFCAIELEEIARWILRTHKHWLDQDPYWQEYVAINYGHARELKAALPG